MLRINKLVLVFVFAVNHVGSNFPPKIFLTLYYESKCPDSKKFIEEQLQPTIYKLHDYLILKLVPFGKASSINNGYQGFICQHGPTECAGNMVQSCALDLMQERNDLEKVSYVACEMRTEAGTNGNMKTSIIHRAGLMRVDTTDVDLRLALNTPSSKYLASQLSGAGFLKMFSITIYCVREAGIQPDAVRKCKSSDKGVALQLAAEYITSLVRPKFIPTITINGQFHQEVQDSALEHLTGVLCAMLRDTPPCAEHYNSRAMQYILY